MREQRFNLAHRLIHWAIAFTVLFLLLTILLRMGWNFSIVGQSILNVISTVFFFVVFENHFFDSCHNDEIRCKTFVKHFRQIEQIFVLNTTHQFSPDEFYFYLKSALKA
jgi:hypothetical protein